MQSGLEKVSNVAVIVACVVTTAWVGLNLRRQLRATAAERAPAVQTVEPAETVTEFDELPSIGSKEARAAIIEFSDFECPFCGEYARDVYPQLKSEFVDSGKLRYVVFNLPLPVHRFAREAARAAICARRQGKYWEMNRQLFANQNDLTPTALRNHARALDIAGDAFDACLASQESEIIDRDMALAAQLGVRSTPTFFIARVEKSGKFQLIKKIRGLQPISTFKKALAEVLLPRIAGPVAPVGLTNN